MSKNAAVLWTGGKDCALAFYKSQLEGHNIKLLVTFTPKNPVFKAHSLALIKLQAKAIDLPHLSIVIDQPIRDSYQKNISLLKQQHHIDVLITGDIDQIDNHNNWIEDCCKPSGMLVHKPLWKLERESILDQLISNNFEVIFSLVKKDLDLTDFLGHRITTDQIDQLKKNKNIDLCGENGAYHTMTLNAPFFTKKIVLTSTIKEDNEYAYLCIQSTKLEEK
ncbi:ATP pyrophosphatase [Polaribacter pacificus]|uniref:ATP pyrophosphatase n=1 Tax=Polaribacter pacificus TaxID=1775173 RepID=A0A917I1Z5_9FLAO|nr:diphthine--ammonia ligase [Polaribacter pacificus]GGH02466.1 ATP pyrophosphatase [Polaribacter pacificus]